MRKNIGFNSETLVVALLMIGGVATEMYVLMGIADPTNRVRLGMLALLPIVWPIYWISRQFPPVIIQRETPQPLRRYSRLRKSVDAFLRDVSRLNWAVVDKNRGFGDLEKAEDEIAAIQKQLADTVVEVMESAGIPDPKPERISRISLALRRISRQWTRPSLPPEDAA